MAISNRKKEQIAHNVIKVLYSRFLSFPDNASNNRNAPFHIAFLNAFVDKLHGRVQNIPDYISLSSWLHGLNTSLGQSFFETTAHILCDGEKRDFKNKQIYSKQVSAIADIMIDLKNGTQMPSVMREDRLIENEANGILQNASNFTADCFFETDNEVVAIELKSVRPNSGEIRGEKQKILQSKAVLKNLYPNKTIKYFFGFPFDPTSETDIGYDKRRFLEYLVEAKKFCDIDEILIGDELWSYLSGSEDTMSEILNIINVIATPNFMNLFNQIQDATVDNVENCRAIFQNWFMYSEITVLDKLSNLLSDRNQKRILNQRIFKTDGSYNNRKLME